jgi:DNA polymerase-3 subunit gamma/tau
VVTALYRRYRPETFAELIGQSQVTDPLRTALRTDRVGHAYLFSGPRGCGKTTSARILARCLNCAEGPTDEPCGVCPSCVELARDGGGSLDVVEIDAASHGGVDDARDLRERAIFAPARDRYKIFIIDEAHMVTSGGFNALLKIVEEPPEHVKFIFATTEPDKVIGTIRSRTHHYPFRLVPPAQMLEYTQELCVSEGVEVEAGVLPLVVRAGGGSVRDTLSLLDQLIAGSDPATGSGTISVAYERAVALLGYTHAALLSDVVDAIGSRDAAAVFAAVDRVVQTGQDPRRFVEDLLERLRDLIVVAATAERAAAVLRGIPEEELQRMMQQASLFGTAELSRTADLVNAALTEMTGATSPRLHLELMVARMLVPEADDTQRGALARVERLERRVGVENSSTGDGAQAIPAARPAAPSGSAPRSAPAPATRPASTAATSIPAASTPPASDDVPAPAPAPAASAAAPSASSAPAVPSHDVASAASAGPAQSAPAQPATVPAAATSEGPAQPVDVPPTPLASAPTPVGPVTLQHIKDAWPEVLEAVEKVDRKAWMVVVTTTARDLVDDVLTVSFVSQADLENFKKPHPSGDSVSEVLRRAILDVLGIRVKYVAKIDAPEPAPSVSPAAPAGAPTQASGGTAPAAGGWAVTAIPTSDPTQALDDDAPPPEEDAPEPEWAAAPPPPEPRSELAASEPAAAPRSTSAASAAQPSAKVAPAMDRARYGEAVVREILGANFLEEQKYVPRVIPRGD